MSAGRAPRPITSRLFLASSAAVAAWLLFQAWGWWVERQGVEPRATERAVADLQRASDEILRLAGEIAATALESSASAAETSAEAGALAAPRLEGVGVLDANGAYLDWSGSPVEPEGHLLASAAPRWIVRDDGIRTRLIVRAGPDRFGFVALACFILDSAPGETGSLRALLPGSRRDMTIGLEFVDTRERYEDVWLDPAARRARTRRAGNAPALLSPDREFLLATLDPEPIAPGLRSRRLRSAGEAWAAALMIMMTAAIVRRRRPARTARGLLVVLAAIGAGRALLLVTEAPARLLPRELGSPSLFGRGDLAGLFASPADSLLTCLAAALACLALRPWLRRLAIRHRWRAAAVATAVAVLATLAVAGMSRSLALHARVELLGFDGFWRRDGPALLLLSWALLLVAAALMWAASWALLRPRGRGVDLAAPVPALLAVVPLALLATATLRSEGERLAIERLRLEFAPETLDQTSYRRVALNATLRQAAGELGAWRPPDPGDPRSERLAFRLWHGSDLFHRGYRSSLDVFTPGGTLLSSFGFDLPPVIDEAFSEPPRGDTPTYREEVFPVGAIPRRLLHAEIAVTGEDGPRAILVGHVLQEPENLSFLASAEPYLAALGADTPQRGAAGESPTPEYVLYDRGGSVLLRTVDRPPTLSREIEIAATLERSLELRAAEDTYIGVPLLDGDLIHLLMVRSPTTVERLGAAARLALLGMGLIGAAILLTAISRPGGVGRLSRVIRGSFYGKLLSTLLLTSVLPLVGLALFVRGYIDGRAAATIENTAVRYVSVAQRVVDDFLIAEFEEGSGTGLDDNVLHWLKRLVGQEIHVYREGRLVASSKRELFTSGLLPERLPGAVQVELTRVGLPYAVLTTSLGRDSVPVAYAPLTVGEAASSLAAGLVVAVPLTVRRADLSRPVDLVVEVLLLATVALAGLVALVAGYLAGSVARPVRDLVGATGRIAAGDYSARLRTAARDEIADLVEGFNAMASSLAAQRADLERRRDYMEALLRNATTGVVSTDADGRIVTVNPAMSALLAIDPARLASPLEFLRALEGHPDLEPLVRALREIPPGLREPQEVDLERAGHARRFRIVRVALPDPHGDPPGSLYLMDDVTELMRSNQLAAWAEMARAIAHEIKNPLTPIQLSAEHLNRLLHDRGILPAPEIDSCIETVIKQVRALHQIAAEFSTYAKLPALELEPCDPVEFARETVAPYKTAPPPDVRIEESYTRTPRVGIDRRVLSRALINLIENALHAMPEGGLLGVEVRPCDESRIAIVVSDTGTGLAAEVRARLFEPYFSTKSSGTGLGLAIVKRTVEAHHGAIEVDSEPGRGTVFRLVLPVWERAS